MFDGVKDERFLGLWDKLWAVRSDEAARVEKVKAAMRAPVRRLSLAVDLPPNAPDRLREMASVSMLNYLPKIERHLVSMLDVKGVRCESDVDGGVWERWQRSRLDAAQNVVYRSCFRYGAGYLEVRKRDGKGAVVVPHGADEVCVLRDPWGDEGFPVAALRVVGSRAQVWDDEFVWDVDFGEFGIGPRVDGAEVSRRPHGFPFCPVVQLSFEPLGDGVGSRVDELMSLQRALDNLQSQMYIARFFTAFRQLYVLGFKPEKAEDVLKVGFGGSVWYLSDPQAKIGAIDPADLKVFLDAKEDALQDMFAVAGLAPQDQGVASVNNVSTETLVASEAPKSRLIEDIQTCLGEGFELALRACSWADGDMVAWLDESAEVSWADKSARSLAQIVDAVVKLVQAEVIPRTVAVKMIPGVSDQFADEIEDGLAEMQGNKLFELLSQRGVGGMVGTAPAPLKAVEGGV